jgi:transposase
MTIQDVANNLKMSWNTVKDIQQRYLERHYGSPRLKDVRYIAIDEFAVQKGHKYMTVVYDLEHGRAIFVGDGRESDVLKPFWKRFKSSGAKLKAVAMDMWPAYLKSVVEHTHDAMVVFDKFHIIKKMNEALDETRRSLYREEVEVNKRSVIKGLRWLLLKNRDHLDKSTNQKKRLEEALAMNQPLAQAYYLKEELHLLWQQPHRAAAEEFLSQWLEKAKSTTIQPLVKFCNMLAGHRSGVLNYYLYPVSTGRLEGFNNKIKVLKRKAYGYRDTEFFKLKIYALHKARYVLL